MRELKMLSHNSFLLPIVSKCNKLTMYVKSNYEKSFKKFCVVIKSVGNALILDMCFHFEWSKSE